MLQIVTLVLDGITAGDYLAHHRDPDPPGLGRELRSVAVRADPLGAWVEVALTWAVTPPAPPEAARAAGLAITPEVVDVLARGLAVAA